MKRIKRYENRKLYDTESGQYVNLSDIANFVRQGEEIQILDHRSGMDVSSSILAQIIVETEKNRQGTLSKLFLTQIIRSANETYLSVYDRIKAFSDPDGFFFETLSRYMNQLVREGLIERDIAQLVLNRFIENGNHNRLGISEKQKEDFSRELFDLRTRIFNLEDEINSLLGE